MAALTADRNTQMKDGELVSLPVAASVKIFAGALVAANATGFVTPGAASTTLNYIGRAEEQADNSAGADGAISVLVRRKHLFKFANLAGDLVTQAELGKFCYIADDQSVAKTSATGTRSPAGMVRSVDADGVWVESAQRLALYGVGVLDFPSIAPAASADLTIAVPGAATGDLVSLGLPAVPLSGLIFMAFVSAAGTVTVRATNITAGALDAAVTTYRVAVFKA